MFGKKNGSGNYSRVDNFSHDSSDEEEIDFVQASIKRQQAQLKKQDEGLDMLSQSAERLGQLSMGISEELDQHNRILNSMDTDLEDAAENLDLVTRKTKELIEQSGGKKNCMIIACLSLIVVILLFLIIYT